MSSTAHIIRGLELLRQQLIEGQGKPLSNYSNEIIEELDALIRDIKIAVRSVEAEEAAMDAMQQDVAAGNVHHHELELQENCLNAAYAELGHAIRRLE